MPLFIADYCNYILRSNYNITTFKFAGIYERVCVWTPQAEDARQSCHCDTGNDARPYYQNTTPETEGTVQSLKCNSLWYF